MTGLGQEITLRMQGFFLFLLRLDQSFKCEGQKKGFVCLPSGSPIVQELHLFILQFC